MQRNTPSDLPMLWPTLTTLPRLAPAHLNGEQGSNRADPALCVLHVNNDYAAIQQWLNKYHHKASTYNSYKKIVEQLLLWSIFQRKKAFSSLTTADFLAYFEFIKDPQPAAEWCAGKNQYAQRKPFTGPASAAAQHTIRVVLHALMSFLVKNTYLKSNPIPHVRAQDRILQEATGKLAIKAPILVQEEWDALLKTLDSMPETSVTHKRDKYRLRFVIEILYHLNLRVNDLAKHTWNAFYQEGDKWWFKVTTTKKGFADRLEVCPELITSVKNYRTFLGYTPFPSSDDIRPIIQRWQGKNPLRPVHINTMLKKLAIQAAKAHFYNEPQKYLKLKGFSAHWLRHFSLARKNTVETTVETEEVN